MFNQLQEVYNGKRVLITGHTGFKGSWMTNWLLKLGASVIGYSLDPEYIAGNYVLSGIKDKIVDIRGDIRDSDKLYGVFENYKPEIVFHFAAQPIVSTSYENPKYTYDVNVMGTLNVLEGIRLTPEVEAGVIVTSDKCYENKEWVWGYRESDSLGGYDPYSSSKGCVELLVSCYANSFLNPKNNAHFKGIATARAGNVIGGGDWSIGRIIPDCIKALQKGKAIKVNNPYSIRPWQHVLEPIGGYLILGAKLLTEGDKFSGAWNFGPNSKEAVSVEALVKKTIGYWGSGRYDIIKENIKHFHESSILRLDISKAQAYLNWYPLWNIDKAIEKTVEWYRDYKDKDVYELCLSQIDEYIKSDRHFEFDY